MQVKRTIAGALLGVVAVTASCGDSGGGGGERTFQNVTQGATLVIEVTGAKTVKFDNAATLQILEADGPDDVDVLVVGTDKGVDAGDNVTLEAFVQLTSYKGNGKYTAKSSSEPKPTALANSAYVQYVRRPPGGEVEVVRYDLVREPCEFVIERNGSKGTAHCRGLASDDGGRVELRMRWEATGERVPITTTSTPPSSSSSSTP